MKASPTKQRAVITLLHRQCNFQPAAFLSRRIVAAAVLPTSPAAWRTCELSPATAHPTLWRCQARLLHQIKSINTMQHTKIAVFFLNASRTELNISPCRQLCTCRSGGKDVLEAAQRRQALLQTPRTRRGCSDLK